MSGVVEARLQRTHTYIAEAVMSMSSFMSMSSSDVSLSAMYAF